MFRFGAVLTAGMLAVSSSYAYSNNPDSTARVGLRAGSNTVEGFVDVMVPYSLNDNAVVFVNPRFLLGDGGENQVNVGVGARYLVDGVGVIGANLYYDKRESELGFDFEQLGIGLEWLGNIVDARINFYQAEDNLELANEFNTLETVINTSVEQSRSEQNFFNTTAVFEAGRATGNRIIQRGTFTDTTTKITTLRTTTTTTEVQTGRLFEQYQGTLDGWDAEIGVKLPLNITPEVRVFGGWYDFDDPFSNNNQLEGYKARAEVRASQYLTFDAEVYEEAHNGSDYFVGVRLEIPLKGKDTFRNLREKLWNSPKRTLRDRMNSEMVMRDVQIHTGISKPIENELARTVKNKQKVEVTTRTSESTTSTTRTGDVVAMDNITFVDADAPGGDTGTAEDPYKTVINAVNNAGAGGIVFVCEHGGGVCDLQGGGGTYDETGNGGTGITLLDDQIITSSLTLNGVRYSRPRTNQKYRIPVKVMILG